VVLLIQGYVKTDETKRYLNRQYRRLPGNHKTENQGGEDWRSEASAQERKD